MSSFPSYKCYCYPESECINDENISYSKLLEKHRNYPTNSLVKNECITDEGCYKIFDSTKNEIRWGCFDNKGPHYLMHCKTSTVNNIDIKCCKDKDFCNRNLTLTSELKSKLQLTNNSHQGNQSKSQAYLSYSASASSSSSTSNHDQFPIHLAFYLALSFAVLLLLSCLIFVLWKSLAYKRKSTLKFIRNEALRTKSVSVRHQSKINELPITGTNSALLASTQPISTYTDKMPELTRLQQFRRKFSRCKPKSSSNNNNNQHHNIISRNSSLSNRSNSNNNNSINWKMGYFISSGVPGSKSSSGVAAKSNGTALSGVSDSAQGFTIDNLEDDTCTSGSGKGLAHLVQRTIGRQITLLECIGNGKFGKVWKARFQGELVAVKVFSSREESSWARETNIYTTILLRHDNILSYYASDLISQSGCTELWMIMQFHELGSLHEYLSQSSLHLSMYDALRLLHSAAAGLCHLHTQIMGLQGKPPIAHRDVKSRNILVKTNGTCCIADLGLAIYPDNPDNNHNHFSADNCSLFSEDADNLIVGTKRYMSPELLQLACNDMQMDGQDKMNDSQFNIPVNSLSALLKTNGKAFIENLKSGDVYSFALVMWEIVNRIEFNGIAQAYQLPFEEYVSTDPSFEDMYKTVVQKNLRPNITEEMKKNMSSVVRMIEECWHQRPSIRHSMLRVKKSLFIILTQQQQQQQQQAQSSTIPFHNNNNIYPQQQLVPQQHSSQSLLLPLQSQSSDSSPAVNGVMPSEVFYSHINQIPVINLPR